MKELFQYVDDEVKDVLSTIDGKHKVDTIIFN